MIKADLIIHNARVLTLDGQNRRAGTVAVHEGKIVGIWQASQVPEEELIITPETNVVDAEEATLIPGFVDTHNHIYGYSQMLHFVDCSTPPNQSIPDILIRLQEHAEQLPAGEWVNGFGYDDTSLEESRHITRAELDKVVPHHPVCVSHISGHLSVVNTAALRTAGIDETISDPAEGYFGRDRSGKLNGLLFEKTAMSYVARAQPEKTEEEMIHTMAKATHDYLAEGITTNTEAALGMSGNPQKELNVIIQAAKRGINPLRMNVILLHTILQEEGLYADYTAEEIDEQWNEETAGKVRLDGAKMFQDGSLQALTGALREGYACEPDQYGELFQEQSTFNEDVLELHNRGFRIAIHGNGDRAIGSILTAYENALNSNARNEHKHRIEHVQTATEADIQKMAELDVAGSFFINHVYYWGERHNQLFLGRERAERISPLQEAVNHNVLFTLHSDCPVTPISPLFSVWAAVNRVTDAGNVLGEDQCIDVVTALKAMTIYGAALNFNADCSGSIEIGKDADFAMLDKDPTAVNPMELKNINVLSTWINGEVVYKKKKVYEG